MVVRNKIYLIIEEYRELLKNRVKQKIANKNLRGLNLVIGGNKSKNNILDFFLKYNRWPSRCKPVNKYEYRLSLKFENFIAKQSGSYDLEFRKLAMLSGRKTNHKRKHNIEEFKKQIVDFLEKHGRAPSTSYEYQIIEGEACLRQKLDYYTQNKNDMTFLSIVYKHDKCHKSGIPAKYRKILNEYLDIEKPLIRLIK